MLRPGGGGVCDQVKYESSDDEGLERKIQSAEDYGQESEDIQQLGQGNPLLDCEYVLAACDVSVCGKHLPSDPVAARCQS